jgi:hypothetical protein
VLHLFCLLGLGRLNLCIPEHLEVFQLFQFFVVEDTELGMDIRHENRVENFSEKSKKGILFLYNPDSAGQSQLIHASQNALERGGVPASLETLGMDTHRRRVFLA